MPAEPWENVVGHKCEECDGPATWIVGGIFICCDCYAGPGMGLISKEDAEYVHAYFKEHGELPPEPYES